MLAKAEAVPVPLVAPVRRPVGFVRGISGAARSVLRWLEWRRQLRALAELDDHLLRDVGLSRDDVRRACAQTFWM